MFCTDGSMFRKHACVVALVFVTFQHATCTNTDVGEYGVDALSPRARPGQGVNPLQSLVVAKYNPGPLGDRYNALNVMPSLPQSVAPQRISNITPAWQPEYLLQARSAGFGGFDCACRHVIIFWHLY